MKKLASALSLFTSVGTLLCCALPALLVTLGMGAAFAGLVSNVPQLIWLSEHKVALFAVGGVLLVLGGMGHFRSRQVACPTDPALAEACRETKGWSYWVWVLAVVFYLVGAGFAFVLPLFL